MSARTAQGAHARDVIARVPFTPQQGVRYTFMLADTVVVVADGERVHDTRVPADFGSRYELDGRDVVRIVGKFADEQREEEEAQARLALEMCSSHVERVNGSTPRDVTFVFANGPRAGVLCSDKGLDVAREARDCARYGVLAFRTRIGKRAGLALVNGRDGAELCALVTRASAAERARSAALVRALARDARAIVTAADATALEITLRKDPKDAAKHERALVALGVDARRAQSMLAARVIRLAFAPK